jgi:hypothetical protein
MLSPKSTLSGTSKEISKYYFGKLTIGVVNKYRFEKFFSN